MLSCMLLLNVMFIMKFDKILQELILIMTWVTKPTKAFSRTLKATTCVVYLPAIFFVPFSLEPQLCII